jgi:hypothetical protein
MVALLYASALVIACTSLALVGTVLAIMLVVIAVVAASGRVAGAR